MKVKHGFIAFGLCVLAFLGLMAIGSPAGQASWLENGTAITGLKTFIWEVDLLIRFEVSELGVELDCLNLSTKRGEVLGSSEASEPNVGHVELLLEGCKAYFTNPELTAQQFCLLFPTALDRTDLTNEGRLIAKGLASIMTHSDKKAYLVLKNFVVEGVAGSLCSITLVGIKGEIVFDLHEGGTREKQLVSVANLALFPNKLKYGITEPLFLGSFWVRLEPKNPWGIC